MIWLIATVLAICLLAYWAALLILWTVMATVALIQAGAKRALDHYERKDNDE